MKDENDSEYEGNTSSDETEEEQQFDAGLSMFERKSMTLTKE